MFERNYTTHRTAVLLVAAAGSLDAYTFLTQGEVFAGLQTGNMILLGVNLGRGNWPMVGHYLFAIAMFALGTFLARMSQAHIRSFPHHQTVILTAEIAMTAFTGLFANHLPSDVVVSLLAITAAAQLQTFRVYNGGPFTPLMMTGNLRLLVDSLYAAPKDKIARAKALDTALILAGFATGAITVSALRPLTRNYTILVTTVFLTLILVFAPGATPGVERPEG